MNERERVSVCAHQSSTTRESFFLLRRETLQLKFAKKGRFVLDDLPRISFLQRFCLPGEERERGWLCALIKEKKRGAEVDRSRTKRETIR